MPFSAEQECFYVTILVFIVVGFQRGWRRELVSLVFVLLAFFLVHPDTSKAFGDFLTLLPSVVVFLASGGKTGPPQSSPQAAILLGGPIGALIIFGAVVALGYYFGNKVFPAPSLPQDRFMGIIPGIVSGAFIIGYLSSYFPKNAAGQPSVTLNLQLLDPINYLPIIFIIVVIALIIALFIASRAKKSPAKK